MIGLTLVTAYLLYHHSLIYHHCLIYHQCLCYHHCLLSSLLTLSSLPNLSSLPTLSSLPIIFHCLIYHHYLLYHQCLLSSLPSIMAFHGPQWYAFGVISWEWLPYLLPLSLISYKFQNISAVNDRDLTIPFQSPEPLPHSPFITTGRWLWATEVL